VCGIDSTVNSRLVIVLIGRAVWCELELVCETDSTVNRGLLVVQIGTAVLVRVSVSVWN
jgi:hypothetical protein